MIFQYKNPTHAFSGKSVGRSAVLMSDIEITAVDDLSKTVKTKGIWDTGATSSVITQKVFDTLQLKPFGRRNVSTATLSNIPTDTYLVDIFLKKELRIQLIEVTVGTIASEIGLDCLIGMDIITLGDFSITNLDGNTCFSFRIPSQHELDFVKKFNATHAVIEAHAKAGFDFNHKCICGSGKKFKNCHGKDLIGA